MNRNVERAMALGIIIGGFVAMTCYAAGRKLGERIADAMFGEEPTI